MATGYYLLDHPNPNYKQYGERRRTSKHGGRLTGAIILHDAEGGTDLTGPDMGAENVAAYIARRSTPGSYHELVDRDTAIPMAPDDYETWHDTTSNPYTVGISVAWNKADLARMTRDQRDSYYRPFARAVLRAVRRFAARGITVPIDRFLTRDEVMAGKPGLSTHSRMDPGRRSDPFGTGSPYEAEFLAVLADEAGGRTTDTPTIPTTAPEDDVTVFIAYKKGDPRQYIGNGITRRYIAGPQELADLKWQLNDAGVKVVDRGEVDRIEWLGSELITVTADQVRAVVAEAVAGLTADVDEAQIVDGITTALVTGLQVTGTLTTKES